MFQHFLQFVSGVAFCNLEEYSEEFDAWYITIPKVSVASPPSLGSSDHAALGDFARFHRLRAKSLADSLAHRQVIRSVHPCGREFRRLWYLTPEVELSL